MWQQKISDEREEKPKKNVLVFYCHNASASYLAQQPLIDKFGMAPNYDSWDDETSALDLNHLEPLSSPDGIQFWHFKHRTGTTPNAYDTIYPCIDAMEQYITEHGEKLDAIVLVAGLDKDCQNEEGILWLKEMKQRFPNVKILADGFHPYQKTLGDLQKEKASNPDYPANVIRSTFAFPLNDEAIVHDGITKVVIQQNDPRYTLAEPIDRMIVNGRFAEQADQLRDMLHIPPYRAIDHSGI